MKQIVKDLAVKRTVEVVYTGGIVEWSADGSRLFSTCSDVVKVINLDGDCSTTTIGEEEDELRITCICLDYIHSRLIVTYNNQMAREYSVPLDNSPSKLLRSWKLFHTAPVLQMCFDSTGKRLATGSADNTVKIWDLDAQHCTHTLKGPGVVSALCFPRDDRLLVGYIGGEVIMFDMQTKKSLHEWKTHSSQVTSIVHIPSSRKVVTVSRDQTASILEVDTTEVLKVLPLFESIECATLAHNGNLITVGEEGTIKEFTIPGARLVRSQKISNTGLDLVLYNRIRDELMAVSAEENIYVCKFSSFDMKKQIVGLHDEIYSTCFLGKECSHLAVGANTTDIRIYDCDTFDCQLVPGHSDSILGLASPHWNPNLLASASKDQSLIIWNFKAGKEGERSTLYPLYRCTGHTNTVTATVFSSLSSKPFVITVSEDTTVKLWSLVDQDLNRHGTPKNINDLPHLTCASTFVAHAKEVACVDVAQTDSIAVTGGTDKAVKLWHVDTNKMQFGIAGTLAGHRRNIMAVRFSPNAQKVASCSGDGTVKVWSLEDKSCLQTFSGHQGSVFCLLFVNNGSQLMSADSVGIVKIWTLASGECESSIEAHSVKIYALTANRSESEYVTAGSDGKIVLWKDISEEKKREAETKARKRLEEEQTLSNLLDQQRYQEALNYALGLIRPMSAYKVIDTLLDCGELEQAIAKLDKQKTQVLLDFASQWNTNSRTSQAAQECLHCVLMLYPPEELLKFPNMKSFLLSAIPYTRRHMERLNKTRQDVAVLNFTWKQMRLS